MSEIYIIKANGEKVVFDIQKLRVSLQKAGASEELSTKIAREIENSLYDGKSTNEIYKDAFFELRKSARPLAARYKLKKAILELGPTGFPFEKFVGELLHHQGFGTQVGVIIEGYCIHHEVDVIAEKEEQHFMVEFKFHSDQGRKCNVKIPLYIQSRFKDVERYWIEKLGHRNKYHKGWIVTNTRFTTDAIQYGECIGLMLVSWDYPQGGSLKERIEASGLHPITCLTSLHKKEKQSLLERDKVLCKTILENPNVLIELGLSAGRVQTVLEEIDGLCHPQNERP
jgi:hypothetical protein